jgi:hypothetical protein
MKFTCIIVYTYIHAYLDVRENCVHAHVCHEYIQSCIIHTHEFTLEYIYAYILTCMHRKINSYMNMHIHACMQA